MATRTTAGTTFSVSAGVPTTFDVAGYGALTYTAVGEVTNYGEFGRVYNLVTHSPVASRGTVKKKGSFNEGQMSLQIGLDTDDAGQVLMKAASLSDNNYAFKVLDQKGDIYYFQGQVMSWKVVLGGVDNITAASCVLELTTSSTGIGVVESLAV
jgi:hypothetical protein